MAKTKIDLTEGGKYWGVVRWCDEDVAKLLKGMGYKRTKENVELVVKMAKKYMADEMIDRGYSWLEYVVGQCKEDLTGKGV